MMRKLKFLAVFLLLALPQTIYADASDVPGSATWYFHVDLKAMKTETASQGVYAWLSDEVFVELKQQAGIDVAAEVDRVTAYSLPDQGLVIVIEGRISQESKDKVLALVAVKGELQPLKSSGKSYYHLQDSDNDHERVSHESGDIRIDIRSLEDEAWISVAVANKLIVTSSEQQMQQLLANNGKLAGSRDHDGALIVLTAERTLLQAGMNAGVIDDDDDSGWESNIIRNTEQVAFLVAAAADMLAVEVKLITTEPEMAQSLASVVRGLLSLVAFDDDMSAAVLATLRGTKVEADGNTLSISLEIAPELIVAALSD